MNITVARITAAIVLLGAAQSTLAQNCQVLDQFPVEIDRPGRYCLDRSHDLELQGNEAAVAIRANDVDFDLAGHTLRQAVFEWGPCNPEFSGEPSIGVLVFESRNVKVHNGALRCFDTGVQLSQGQCRDCNVGNQVIGLRIQQSLFSGIFAEGRFSVFADNHIIDTGSREDRAGHGIHSNGDGNTIRNNDVQLVRGDGTGISTANANNTLVVDNRIQNAKFGLLLYQGRNVRYRDNLTAATSIPFTGLGTDLGNND